MAVRSEIEYYLGRIYDVARLSLATVPILAGALIALVADQGTWSAATERPILIGIFCLLGQMFLLTFTYLWNIGMAHCKAVTRAADYIKIHLADYLCQPIIGQLQREPARHIFRSSRIQEFLFWESFLSQHGYKADDGRYRNNYDAGKNLMRSSLAFLLIALIIISIICVAAFITLFFRFEAVSASGRLPESEVIVLISSVMFIISLIRAALSFTKLFAIISETVALAATIDGGVLEQISR